MVHSTAQGNFEVQGSEVSQLFGVKNVRLCHDQALIKEAGGGITPWHQDAMYWPLDGTKCITMWMPLVDITTDMGVLTFATSRTERRRPSFGRGAGVHRDVRG